MERNNYVQMTVSTLKNLATGGKRDTLGLINLS